MSDYRTLANRLETYAAILKPGKIAGHDRQAEVMREAAKALRTLPVEANGDERNCGTCAHRDASGRCQVTGYYCEIECKYGGHCMKSGVPSLWAPRRPLHQRVVRFFVGAKG